MAYGMFADVYDLFNDDADYIALHKQIVARLQSYGIMDGIVVDLGCGTGDLTLLLAQDGYDMIGIDLSTEMLSILREKADDAQVSNLLLLCQDLTQLDLYGTVRAAVSTFDTLNHIGPVDAFRKAIARAALFIEPGGVMIFDMNTPYKHKAVLANQVYELEADDVLCTWYNAYEAKKKKTHMTIEIKENGELIETEMFYEYAYTLTEIRDACEAAGLTVTQVCDGEHFGALQADSQRYLITAVKNETPERNQ